jgi:hypothetical protein
MDDRERDADQLALPREFRPLGAGSKIAPSNILSVEHTRFGRPRGLGPLLLILCRNLSVSDKRTFR